jgi:hypothetical protein
MNLRKLTYLTITVGLGIFAVNDSRADVVQILNFSVTTYTQSPVNDDGTNTVAAAPKVKTRTTTDLVKALAQDEFDAGNWPSNSFPTTAKIAVGNNGFFIINGTNVLVSVADVMSFQSGDNDVKSGKRNDLTGLSLPTVKKLQIGRITFDDSAIYGGTPHLKFFIQGLVSDSTSDTVPNSSGNYTETQSGKMTNGAGEGVDSDGTPFVLTGTVTVAGKGTQQLPP